MTVKSYPSVSGRICKGFFFFFFLINVCKAFCDPQRGAWMQGFPFLLCQIWSFPPGLHSLGVKRCWRRAVVQPESLAHLPLRCACYKSWDPALSVTLRGFQWEFLSAGAVLPRCCFLGVCLWLLPCTAKGCIWPWKYSRKKRIIPLCSLEQINRSWHFFHFLFYPFYSHSKN